MANNLIYVSLPLDFPARVCSGFLIAHIKYGKNEKVKVSRYRPKQALGNPVS